MERATRRRERQGNDHLKPASSLLHRQLMADHACGGDEDVVGLTADQRGGGRRGPRAFASPLSTRRGVGVAGVDDDRPALRRRASGRGPISRARHRRGSW